MLSCVYTSKGYKSQCKFNLNPNARVQCMVGGSGGFWGENREGGREGGNPKCQFSETLPDSQLGMAGDIAPFLSTAKLALSVWDIVFTRGNARSFGSQNAIYLKQRVARLPRAISLANKAWQTSGQQTNSVVPACLSTTCFTLCTCLTPCSWFLALASLYLSRSRQSNLILWCQPVWVPLAWLFALASTTSANVFPRGV